MQTTAFAIDKTIPIPTQRRQCKYPFGEMGIGDSFFAENKNAVTAAYVWAGRHPDVKFVTRAEADGARIWRRA